MRSPRSLAWVLVAVGLACKSQLPTDALDSGSDSSSTESSTSDQSSSSDETDTAEPPACDLETLHACNDARAYQLEYCVDEDCGPGEGLQSCLAKFEEDYAMCTEAFCPADPDASTSDCFAACDNIRSICEPNELCSINDCTYAWSMCADTCYSCTEVSFEFEYPGACELLVLPGPPFGLHEDHVGLYIAGQERTLSEPLVDCGDPGGHAAVWKYDAAVELCDLACQEYATAGAATIVFGCPPSE